KSVVVGALAEDEGAQILDNPICACGGELGVRGGGAQGDYFRASGFCGANSGGGVLDYETFAGSEAYAFRAEDIGFGVGFAALDVARGDEAFGQRQPRGADAHFGERASARSND